MSEGFNTTLEITGYRIQNTLPFLRRMLHESKRQLNNFTDACHNIP